MIFCDAEKTYAEYRQMYLDQLTEYIFVIGLVEAIDILTVCVFKPLKQLKFQMGNCFGNESEYFILELSDQFV